MDVKNLQSMLQIKHVSTTGYSAGDIVIKGSLVTYVLKASTSGDLISLIVIGQGEVTKNAGEAWTVGQKVYWDSGDSNFTTTATSNSFAGIASDVAASAAVIGRVLFNSTTLNDSGGTATNVIEITDNSGGTSGDETVAEIADIALSTTDTYTDSAVNAAVNAAIDDTSNAVATIIAKQTEILAALEAAGLMATT